MEVIELEFNLKMLNESNATVQGDALAIEDNETGKVYLTNKKYIDKLFGEMGYKNLSVVKVLEEYAGKVVSSIGSLSKSKIYVDDGTSSFVVISEDSLNKIKDLFKFFSENSYEIVEVRKRDDYYYWDQVTVKSPTGTTFALYINLCEEYIQVLSLKYDDSEFNLTGIINEGRYKLEDDDFIMSLQVLMSNPIDASVGIDSSKTLSLDEYVRLLTVLGYVEVKKRSRSVSLTEKGETASKGLIPDLDQVVDEYNIRSWIQRHIVDSKVTFERAFSLISSNLCFVTFWDVKDFFTMNSSETSDMFAVNW